MLRKILGKPSLFIDREETNERMYEEIPSLFVDREGTNERMYEEMQHDRRCKFVSGMEKKQDRACLAISSLQLGGSV